MSKNTMTTIEKMILAVQEQGCSYQNMVDAANHGASGGFPGFCYYDETAEFFDTNKNLIFTLLKEECEGMGCNEQEYLNGFNDKETGEIFIKFLLGNADEHQERNFKNNLAWWSLETTGHYVEMATEDDKDPQYWCSECEEYTDECTCNN